MLRKVFSLAIISILILTACGTRDDVMASFQYTLESIHKVMAVREYVQRTDITGLADLRRLQNTTKTGM